MITIQSRVVTFRTVPFGSPSLRRMLRLWGSGFILVAAFVGSASADGTRFMVVHDPADIDAMRTLVVSGAATDPTLGLVESWTADDEAFTVVDAASDSTLASRLDESGIDFKRVRTILDLNSPERGGGSVAGETPRDGHVTFMIQRSIPGVGYFPPEKKSKIAAGSNAAIAKIGDSIEWVHSYLTDEGTFCVYRATDEATIREHGFAIGPQVLDVDIVQKVDIPSG